MIRADHLDLERAPASGFGGGRKGMRVAGRSGRFTRAEPLRENDRDYVLAADATLRAALLRQGGTGPEGRLTVAPEDLRKKVLLRPARPLIVFVVDTSDSMGDAVASERIRAAKGTVLAVLGRAYPLRCRVGLVVFRDEAAEIVVPPTASLSRAERHLRRLPTGGATPFAAGLMSGWRMIRGARLKDPAIRPLLVVLSDGEANVPYDPGRASGEVLDELLEIGARIGGDGVASLVVETRPLSRPSATMRRLAGALGGEYHHISSLKAGGMAQRISSLGARP